MTITIVVARYNEDVEWTKQFPNVIIYNKGDRLPDSFNQVLLSNVGREGHTYFKYICDNYDNLSDYTVFLQGKPFDHSPNIISDLNKCINNNDLQLEFKFLSELILTTNVSGCPHHNGLPLIDVYEKLFNERKENLQFEFGAGAQFIVCKKNILNRSKEFYNKIVEMLQYEVTPIEVYIIERLYKPIFTLMNN